MASAVGRDNLRPAFVDRRRPSPSPLSHRGHAVRGVRMPCTGGVGSRSPPSFTRATRMPRSVLAGIARLRGPQSPGPPFGARLAGEAPAPRSGRRRPTTSPMIASPPAATGLGRRWTPGLTAPSGGGRPSASSAVAATAGTGHGKRHHRERAQRPGVDRARYRIRLATYSGIESSRSGSTTVSSAASRGRQPGWWSARYRFGNFFFAAGQRTRGSLAGWSSIESFRTAAATVLRRRRTRGISARGSGGRPAFFDRVGRIGLP
jgi:hypothetical protein